MLDIAAAAGVSLQQLEQAFLADDPLGLRPEQYLERSRLSGAHADLVAADPTRGATVAAIAAQWGFPHPGRFAARYRAVYGRPPKWVLDR